MSRSPCGVELMGTRDLRKQVWTQLIVFTVINTVTSIINLATKSMPDAELNATTASLCLLFCVLPFGVWGLWYTNRGVLAIYIIFGILSGMVRVVLTVVASVMVATSCQIEQAFFAGCYAAIDELPCLGNSTCSRDAISSYNSGALRDCDAWSTDDCSDAPSARTSMGFTGLSAFFLALQVFTSYMPVYFAFLYYTRLEVNNPVVYEGDCDGNKRDEEEESMSKPLRYL